LCHIIGINPKGERVRMRVTIEGEAAQSLQESASLHGDTPAQRLGKAVNILEFLEKQELAGIK